MGGGDEWVAWVTPYADLGQNTVGTTLNRARQISTILFGPQPFGLKIRKNLLGYSYGCRLASSTLSFHLFLRTVIV